MIKTVFLDMDGVLTNFHKGVYGIFNQPYEYLKQIVWNFWEAWDKPVTREDVNIKCNTNFWEHLEWMHDGHKIIEVILRNFRSENIYLLTNPIVGGAGTATGKILWVEKHLPNFYNQIIITQLSKGLLAKPNTLLIDDNDNCIKEFKQAGGQTILIPRPWNLKHKKADISFAVLEEEINKLIERN